MMAMSGQTGPIRILLTVPHLESTASPYREMMAVARYLPKPEFSLTICSLRDNGREAALPLLQELGVKVFVARYRPRGKSVGHFLSCARDQGSISAEGPFDLQHSLDFSSAPVEAILSRVRRRRFIFTQRNLNEGGHPTLLRIKCFLARRVVAISGAVRILLESLGLPNRKVVEIALGIEETEPSGSFAGLPVAGPFVLSVGQIERRKRHEDAIEAFAAIAGEAQDLSLCIAGRVVDQTYAADLGTLIERKGLAGRVYLLGSRSDVRELMQRARCLLHCAESEAFGWVILEAMSAELPVVASSVGGIKEVVQDGRTGFLVPVGDVAGYGTALRRVLRAPDEARELSDEALRLVREKYTASIMVRRLADLYRAVCAA
jgi:glycosyltransferase involved in cell wall biosynthesis